jgi:TRAP-type C4-dicarboxylate transport system substrate-binding protein
MNTRRRFIALAAGGALALAAQAAGAEVITLKMAHQWPQDESDYIVHTGTLFAKEVERRTNGQIRINIFPAESLVKAGATHTALKSGAVDLAVYPLIYSAGAIPEMNLTLLPGVWKSHDDVYRFRESRAWKTLEQKAEQYGFKTLAWMQISGGVASTKKPVIVPADVAGAKARTAGKMMEAAIQKAGASTVSVTSPETYNAMQLGVLDTVWTSSSTFGSLRLYEVSKYYTSPEKLSIFFTLEPIVISMKTWNRLTPEQQKILVEVGKSLEAQALEGARKEDGRVANLFREHNVKVEQLTPEAWNEWQKLFRESSFEKFRKDVPNGSQLLDETLDFYK